MSNRSTLALTALVATLVVSSPAHAQWRTVTATVTNLAPTNSVSFAPLHVGFHNGTFDSFDLGGVAGAGIVSVAEGGSGTQWQADFAAADPTATRGTIGGLLTPGATASLSFNVNTAINPFFSFAAMVVPSNDFFIGNDNPMRLFDDMGNLLTSSIFQTTDQIWDAGSEAFDPGERCVRRQQRFAHAAELRGGLQLRRARWFQRADHRRRL